MVPLASCDSRTRCASRRDPVLTPSRSTTRKCLRGAGGLQWLAAMIATDTAFPAQGAHAAPGRRPLTCGVSTMRGVACLAAILLADSLFLGPFATRGLAADGTESVTRLGTDGTRFTVNGRPAFLFGVSYYGALGASDET